MEFTLGTLLNEVLAGKVSDGSVYESESGRIIYKDGTLSWITAKGVISEPVSIDFESLSDKWRFVYSDKVATNFYGALEELKNNELLEESEGKATIYFEAYDYVFGADEEDFVVNSINQLDNLFEERIDLHDALNAVYYVDSPNTPYVKNGSQGMPSEANNVDEQDNVEPVKQEPEEKVTDTDTQVTITKDVVTHEAIAPWETYSTAEEWVHSDDSPHVGRKLSTTQVRYIYIMYDLGFSVEMLAEANDVTTRMIYYILDGTYWTEERANYLKYDIHTKLGGKHKVYIG